jgi:hypothetical protein
MLAIGSTFLIDEIHSQTIDMVWCVVSGRFMIHDKAGSRQIRVFGGSLLASWQIGIRAHRRSHQPRPGRCHRSQIRVSWRPEAVSSTCRRLDLAGDGIVRFVSFARKTHNTQHTHIHTTHNAHNTHNTQHTHNTHNTQHTTSFTGHLQLRVKCLRCVCVEVEQVVRVN